MGGQASISYIYLINAAEFTSNGGFTSVDPRVAANLAKQHWAYKVSTVIGGLDGETSLSAEAFHKSLPDWKQPNTVLKTYQKGIAEVGWRTQIANDEFMTLRIKKPEHSAFVESRTSQLAFTICLELARAFEVIIPELIPGMNAVVFSFGLYHTLGFRTYVASAQMRRGDCPTKLGHGMRVMFCRERLEYTTRPIQWF